MQIINQERLAKNKIFSLSKRPFLSPRAIMYSYYAVEKFLPKYSFLNVLEVGCGLGQFSLLYSNNQHVRKILAIDISKELICYLNTYYAKHYPKITFQHGDFCDSKLNIYDKFDLIYSSDVLEHIYSVKQFINNSHNLLSENGTLIINFPNSSDHGFNQFNNSSELVELFSKFNSLNLYKVTISDSFTIKIYLLVKSIYDFVSKINYKIIREKVEHTKEQGTDYFHETSAFKFAKNLKGIKKYFIVLLSNFGLIRKSKIKYSMINKDEDILGLERIIIVATK